MLASRHRFGRLGGQPRQEAPRSRSRCPRRLADGRLGAPVPTFGVAILNGLLPSLVTYLAGVWPDGEECACSATTTPWSPVSRPPWRRRRGMVWKRRPPAPPDPLPGPLWTPGLRRSCKKAAQARRAYHQRDPWSRQDATLLARIAACPEDVRAAVRCPDGMPDAIASRPRPNPK